RPALRSLLEKGCFDRLVVLKKGERGRRVFEFYEMPGETGGYRLLGAQ
ncbi:MAG: hypothetical protein HYY09_08960, partial [Firmicutes bacterium]|nr:hypothetical protein [Bacillota bacterium]